VADTFTAYGAVRGGCGHHHRTGHAAWECAHKDDLAVKRGNGPSAYSDRVVYVVTDGVLIPLLPIIHDNEE
jgi:hypothetical protein